MISQFLQSRLLAIIEAVSPLWRLPICRGNTPIPHSAQAARGLLLLLAFNTGTHAAEMTSSLALRKIMQELGQNMQAITDGISREDWKRVAETAPLIANHPQPPWTEKARILRFIGGEAAMFKEFDSKAAAAAKEVAKAAARGDGPGVISNFAQLQMSCLGCHQRFRASFHEHFYQRR